MNAMEFLDNLESGLEVGTDTNFLEAGWAGQMGVGDIAQVAGALLLKQILEQQSTIVRKLERTNNLLEQLAGIAR